MASTCGLPVARSSLPTDEDCDDQNADIYPGAADLPGNTVDEDCDGTLACDPTAEWRYHGQFVFCVIRQCIRLRRDGLVTRRECRELMWDAIRSSVGKTWPAN